jgi:hypothetical protein
MGQMVNGSMRLCIVALFQRDAEHAETALRHQEALRLLEPPSIASQGELEQAVARSLGEVVKQTHEIADAIIFWLEGKSCTAAPASDKHISVEHPPTQRRQHAAALSYLQPKRTPGPKITQRLSC